MAKLRWRKWMTLQRSNKSRLPDLRGRTPSRLQQRYHRSDLLCVDELGFVFFDRTGTEFPFNLFSGHYERRSTLVNTNLSFGEWVQVFVDEKLTTQTHYQWRPLTAAATCAMCLRWPIPVGRGEAGWPGPPARFITGISLKTNDNNTKSQLSSGSLSERLDSSARTYICTCLSLDDSFTTSLDKADSTELSDQARHARHRHG